MNGHPGSEGETLRAPAAGTEKEYKVIAALTRQQQSEKFLAAIDTRLQKDSANVELLLEKAQLYRRIGDYDRSRHTYARIVELDGDQAYAKTALSILSGEAVSHLGVGDYQPAPFIFYREFFPPATVDLLYDTAVGNQTSFIDAGVNSMHREYKPDKRQSLVLHEIGEAKTLFRGFLHEQLPEYCRRLGVAPFAPGDIEVKMTNHLDGGFFKTHSDNAQPFDRSGRGISYIYYFHRRPRRFSGGDLLLFDTNRQKHCYRAVQFTRIRCECNSLVVFPSDWFHCVEPISLPENRFDDGRMAVTGHIKYAVHGQ